MNFPRDRFLVSCRHNKGIHIYPFAFTCLDSARYFTKQVLRVQPEALLSIMPEGEFFPDPHDSIYEIQENDSGLPFMVEV